MERGINDERERLKEEGKREAGKRGRREKT